MSKLSYDDIKKIASLSRLKLTDEEVSKFQKELSAIVEYVQILQNADVEGLEPTSQVTGLMNVARNDEIIDYGVSTKELLKNAPAKEAGQFKVSRMVG